MKASFGGVLLRRLDHIALASLLCFLGLPLDSSGAEPPKAVSQDTLAQATVQPSEQKPPIKIGFIAPLSGRIAANGGKEMLNGIKLFLEENHYQIAGRKVELLVEDDENSTPVAVAKIRKLVEHDKVDILDGILLASMASEIAPFIDHYQVPMIFPVSAGDDITKRKYYKWVIRTSWSASQAGHPLGEYAYKTLGYRKVVIFGIDFSMPWEVAGGFQKTFEEAGGQVIQKIWAPMASNDYSEYIRPIKKNADAIFVITSIAQADTVARQIREYFPHTPIIGGGPSYDEATLRAVGEPTVGAVTSYFYSAALDTPVNKRFITAYRAKYGIEPGIFAENCYVSGMWIKKAAEALNGNISNRDKLLQELRKVKLADAPRGPVKLDDLNNPIENFYIRKVERVNGVLENKVIYTYPNVSQFWKYPRAEFLKQPPYSHDYPPCRYCADGAK